MEREVKVDGRSASTRAEAHGSKTAAPEAVGTVKDATGTRFKNGPLLPTRYVLDGKRKSPHTHRIDANSVSG
jgi:hypothetical protein